MKLFAGPYCGEFGWTLFCWQGFLRWIVEQHELEDVVICGHDDTKVLYDDFCTTWISHNTYPTNPDCWTGHMTIPQWWSGLVGRDDIFFAPNTNHIYYTANWGRYSEDWSDSFLRQSFIPYGTSGTDRGYDVLLHIRHTTKNNTGYRNWPIKKWLELKDKLLNLDLKVACIGTKDSSLWIEGTDNLRGISLEQLADIISSSSVIAGPSSGPLHFASLCKTPQVVWSAMYNYNRYMYHWNPFHTPVWFIDEGCPHKHKSWNPRVETVLSTIVKALNNV